MAIAEVPLTHGKHRIYRYNGTWYSICGRCTRPLMGVTWGVATGLLRLHVEGHEYVDNPLSAASH